MFPSDEAWSEALGKYEKMIEKLPSFKGTLAHSAESLADWMDFSCNIDILGERIEMYAVARNSEDERSDKTRNMMGKGEMARAKRQAAGAWADPEILAIPKADIDKFLDHPRLDDYRMYIGRILRLRPHTLNEAEDTDHRAVRGRSRHAFRYVFGAGQCGYGCGLGLNRYKRRGNRTKEGHVMVESIEKP